MDFPRGDGSIFCGRCAHPLPDETQSFCNTCGGAFSKYPPTTDFVLLAERQLEIATFRNRRRNVLISGFWAALCLVLFFTASSMFRQTRIARLTADREVEFYMANIEGYPVLETERAREAVLVALQSFEDHFKTKVKSWKFIEDEVPADISGFLKNMPKSRLDDLSSWENYFRRTLMPQWYQSPYRPLRVFITNFPLRAPEFLRMETRHLSSSRLVGGFATPAFVLISSYRMLTELKETEPTHQARYLGEYLIAHELGHALVGLPDFVSPQEFKDFAVRGIASSEESPYSRCVMHTDEGGGQNAWAALKRRSLGKAASCFSYAETLRAHELHREAIEAAQMEKYDLAHHKLEMALAILPTDKTLPWLRDLWNEEQRLLSRF